MSNIYISYNHQDRKLASKISSGLKEKGHLITLDVESLTAGQEWRTILMDALKSADGVIVLITPSSLKSQFVLSEIGSARAFTQTSKNKFLIPVIFDDAPIPPVIQDIHSIIGDRNKIPEVVNQINQAIDAFLGRKAAVEEKEEKEREFIESKASAYVEKAMTALSSREKKNKNFGIIWYILGYSSLIVGVFVAVFGFGELQEAASQEYLFLIAIGLKSLIIIALLLASSKYAFNLGKSYMQESLKNADRIHAISYGHFYLNAFGDQASNEELKDVFQHWNIDKSSSFLGLKSDDYDPKFFETLIELTKVVTGKKGK